MIDEIEEEYRDALRLTGGNTDAAAMLVVAFELGKVAAMLSK
jgi:hypothetical protein